MAFAVVSAIVPAVFAIIQGLFLRFL